MAQIDLGSLSPGAPKKGKKRLGRGTGSGHGKTSGRGGKGQTARAGGGKGPAFEGGQLPLQRRLPKRGFTNAAFATKWRTINVGRLAVLPAGTVVTAELLSARGLIVKGRLPLKVLGDGQLDVALTVRADAFSAGATTKITAAGGRAEPLSGDPDAAGAESGAGA